MPGLYIKFNFVLAPFAKTAEQLGANVGSRELLFGIAGFKRYTMLSCMSKPRKFIKIPISICRTNPPFGSTVYMKLRANILVFKPTINQ